MLSPRFDTDEVYRRHAGADAEMLRHICRYAMPDATPAPPAPALQARC